MRGMFSQRFRVLPRWHGPIRTPAVNNSAVESRNTNQSFGNPSHIPWCESAACSEWLQHNRTPVFSVSQPGAWGQVLAAAPWTL